MRLKVVTGQRPEGYGGSPIDVKSDTIVAVSMVCCVLISGVVNYRN